MSEFVDLVSTYERLRRALERLALPHAFIGAMPVFAWARPRATGDLDLVLACAEAQWPSVVGALRSEGFELRSQAGPANTGDITPDIAFFWLAAPHPMRADVFVAKTPFEEAVLATARETNVLGKSMKVASPEASIIYKLLASRSKDIADVDALFEARALIADALDWVFLDHWAREWGIESRLEPYRRRYGPQPRKDFEPT